MSLSMGNLFNHCAVCRSARHCIEIPIVKSLECVEVYVFIELQGYTGSVKYHNIRAIETNQN